MFCRKTDYLKRRRSNIKPQKTVFNSNEPLEDLLLHSNEVSIPQEQLRQLTIEIYISLTDLTPEFIKLFFTVKELSYNLRHGHILNLPLARTTYGTNSILFRACQVWKNLPLSIIHRHSLLEFETNIKKTLRSIECLCKICKI